MIPAPRAQAEPVERIGEGFRVQTAEGQEAWTVLAVLGAVLLAAGALALVLASRRERPGRRLFRELARASGLTGAETRLLLALALAVQPDDPPAIFVRRSAFEAAAEDSAADPALIEALRRKVYGP